MIRKDLPSYSRAVQSCGRAKRWDYALHLFDLVRSLPSKGLDPIFCTTLLGACRYAAAWQPALAILHELEMGVLGFRPTVHHYGATASCLEFVGKWDKALALMSSLKARELVPSVQLYGATITACEKSCQWERALILLRTMGGSSPKPDVMAYNTAIAACGKGRRWKDAVWLMSEMRTVEIMPSTVSYSIAEDSEFCLACSWRVLCALRSACTDQPGHECLGEIAAVEACYGDHGAAPV